jgi:type II secretory pathway component PulJ
MLILALSQLAAGFRLALVLFAVMSLLSTSRWMPDAVSDARRMQAQRLNKVAWMLVAVSILIYSPTHASWLMGHPSPPIVNRALDMIASGLACAAFIRVLAYRGLMRGLTWQRVRWGMRVNILTVGAVLVAACLAR